MEKQEELSKNQRDGFKCPNCEKQYNDRDDKYLDRCQNNKSGITKIKCECGKHNVSNQLKAKMEKKLKL